VIPLDTPADLQRLMRADYPLSDEQFAACTAPLSPAVVIAGAGSGKTTLMAARVVWLVASGLVRPEEVLGLTFTTKAAGELATRIRGALDEAGLGRSAPREDADGELLEPTVATYNAYAASLLSDHGLRIGHEPDTRVVTEAARHQLAARVISRHTREVRHLSEHPGTVIDRLLGLDAALNEHLVDPADVLALQERERPRIEEELAGEGLKTQQAKLATALSVFAQREELLHLVADYRDLKRRLGLMEFSDQISLGARLASTRPEVGELERSRFKVVLLDEYQDTSVAQAIMLSRLFSGPDADHGRGHAVMAVGDPNQAIYGWRGASVSNILRFGEAFPAADGSTEVPVLSLRTNRRSDRGILDLANHLAGPLYAGAPGVQPLVAKPDAEAGEIRAECFETYADELAWLPAQVRAARERFGSWKDVAVLTRDNQHAADVYEELTRADVPVEIVGLKGLLQLPEVADVVATLSLLEDLTDNAAMLTLLTGPRWAIGPRDLALLGARAAELAGRARPESALDLSDALSAAVAGADPTEVVSLADALDDPGTPRRGDWSDEALERFALLSAELARLRRHVGEPLLDLVRRIVDTTGVDVELASSVSEAARARRDNLDLFVRAVADFRAVDGEVTLTALLSYLGAEEEDDGMEVATPTAADTVKLLTVHKAKGLEWDAVFLVGVAKGRFPSDPGGPKWFTSTAVFPTPLRGDRHDLPSLPGWTRPEREAYDLACRAHAETEELRLGYVAMTRPRHLLVVTSHVWAPGKARPRGPSSYQRTVREWLEEQVATGAVPGPLPVWPEEPPKGAPNPCDAVPVRVTWPPEQHTTEALRRVDLAARVAAEWSAPTHDDGGLTAEEAALVAAWDAESSRLLEEARARVAETLEVPLPAALSATELSALREDPRAFAEQLARPMPRPPAPAARTGTRFHAWVEQFLGARQEVLLDLDDVSGRGDPDFADDADLQELADRFREGPYADRKGAVLEQPFALVLAGQVVRGRIDAAFPEDDGSWLLVDWKTSRRQSADPLQLAIYRVAWAELHGLPLDRVRAEFYYVRDGAVVAPESLPGREELEALISP
jgi:DNA helicase-2/ATP-dependent DNA helicase PcrA